MRFINYTLYILENHLIPIFQALWGKFAIWDFDLCEWILSWSD